MLVTVIGGKIHSARVTQCELHYHGSVTIDQNLLDASGIFPGQYVNIWNKANGARLQTYVFPGERGSKIICLNGAAARHFQLGDDIIIASEVQVTLEELKDFKAKVCVCNDKNDIIDNLIYHIFEDTKLGNSYNMHIVADGVSKTIEEDLSSFNDVSKD